MAYASWREKGCACSSETKLKKITMSLKKKKRQKSVKLICSKWELPRSFHWKCETGLQWYKTTSVFTLEKPQPCLALKGADCWKKTQRGCWTSLLGAIKSSDELRPNQSDLRLKTALLWVQGRMKLLPEILTNHSCSVKVFLRIVPHYCRNEKGQFVLKTTSSSLSQSSLLRYTWAKLPSSVVTVSGQN